MGMDEKEKKEDNWRSSVKVILEGLSGGGGTKGMQFWSLVTEYEEIFARNSSDLRKLDLLEHEIHTGDCQPIKQPLRHVPPY